jgi:hypothetical protein
MKKLNTLNTMMMMMDMMKREERKHKFKYTRAHADTTDHKDLEKKMNFQTSQVDDKRENDITKDGSLQNDVYGSRTMTHTEVNKGEGT